MTRVLDRLFGPDDGRGIAGRMYPSHALTSIPDDHAHSWYARVVHGIDYWECGLCNATRCAPPEDDRKEDQ